jgi:hypothetical protein
MIMFFARKLLVIRLFDQRRHLPLSGNSRNALCTAAVVNALWECDRSALQSL